MAEKLKLETFPVKESSTEVEDEFTYDFGAAWDEAPPEFRESAFKQTVIASIRNTLRKKIAKGDTHEEMQEWLDNYKPGHVTRKSKVDKARDYISQMSPEEREEFFAAMEE